MQSRIQTTKYLCKALGTIHRHMTKIQTYGTHQLHLRGKKRKMQIGVKKPDQSNMQPLNHRLEETPWVIMQTLTKVPLKVEEVVVAQRTDVIMTSHG